MSQPTNPFAELKDHVLENIAQSMLAAKTSASNVISLAESTAPLFDDPDVANRLERLRHHAEIAKQEAYELYKLASRPAWRKEGK